MKRLHILTIVLVSAVQCCAAESPQQQAGLASQQPPKALTPLPPLQQPPKQLQYQTSQQQTLVPPPPPPPPTEVQPALLEPTAKQLNQKQPAKDSHGLVSKIKDARHRRRNRHQRNRGLQYHKRLAEKAKSKATTHSDSQNPLMVLESIVEEVARVGQPPGALPGSSPISSKHSVGPAIQQASEGSSVSAAKQGQEVLLEGSNPPMSPLQQTAGAQPSSLAHIPGIRAAVGHNSRGFLLTTMLSKIINVLNITEFAHELKGGISSRASCMACNAVVGLFLSPLYSKEVFSVAIRTVCTSFKIQPARVCSGLVASFEDDFEIIRKNTRLTRDEVCALVFGIDCARRQTQRLFWTVPIPEPLSSPTVPVAAPLSESDTMNMEDAPDLFEYRKLSPTQSPSRTGEEEEGSSQRKLKALKRAEYILDDESAWRNKKVSSFVQITDIHIDPYYEPGSLNDCNEPLCCRATSGPVLANDKRRQAGRWGDYGNCDLPIRTLKNALNRIRSQHADAEYWIWTGDISPHDIWNITKAESANNVRLVTKLVREYSNGLPVFPVIGNHEAHPVNSFSPPEVKGKFSMSWLYNLLADEWSIWLPKDAIKTLRTGGYYKLQLRKGFRIIALNTNYCARLNPWSFFDPVDPANQLKWLVDELMEAEINRDKVHIIGHVPPDNRECTQAWLFNYINIIDRFRDTILAQFFGHTHRDEWRMMYSLRRQNDPIGIAFIGPSITPYTENNPAYRVYHQDKAGNLLDSHTYYFNLTEANESATSEPRWQFSYSTQAHTNITSGLTANNWHHYLQKLHEDETLFDSFFRNFYRYSDVKMGQTCRGKCRHQLLSDMRLTHPYRTKPKPFLANRKTSGHHNRHERHDHHHHHHHHHKRNRHSE